MNFEQIFDFLTKITIWSVFKVFYLVGFIVYAIFVAVVFKQILLMTQSISSPFNSLLRSLGFIHLVCSIIILVVMFQIL